MKRFAVLAVVVGIVSGTIACGPKKNSLLQVGTITFVTGDVMVNSNPAGYGMKVKSGDQITTSEKSCAVIQFSQSSIVALKSNTTLTINKFIAGDTDNKDQVELFMRAGECFNKIAKGKADYTIKSNTMVAAVRGTAFLFSAHNDGETEVKLLHGIVDVNSNTIGKSPLTIDDAKKISSFKGVISSPIDLTVEEITELSSLDSIEFINNIKNDSSKPVNDDIKLLLVNNSDITNKAVVQIDMTRLNALAAKYGKLSVIRTKSGSVYVGSFKQVGKNMEIITIDGKEVIPSSSIDKISPFKM